jgi:isopenicillin N synthase-like dioxygenase
VILNPEHIAKAASGQPPASEAERDPLLLFRIFHYRERHDRPRIRRGWGVGEHTDYGVLTILKQDDAGGLQVKSRSRWIAAPPIAGAFLCNIGDMLDRMTGGRYRSTPHRVSSPTERDRLSFPFFFDPNFDAKVQPIDLGGVACERASSRRPRTRDVPAAFRC